MNYLIWNIEVPEGCCVCMGLGGFDESFPLAGIRKVVAYGESLYSSIGRAGCLDYFEDRNDGHGYQKAKRGS